VGLKVVALRFAALFLKNHETTFYSSTIGFFEYLLDRSKKEGAPIIGLNLLMRGSTLVKLTNLLSGLKDGALELQSGLFKK